jgi:hypothetical protein
MGHRSEAVFGGADRQRAARGGGLSRQWPPGGVDVRWQIEGTASADAVVTLGDELNFVRTEHENKAAGSRSRTPTVMPHAHRPILHDGSASWI